MTEDDQNFSGKYWRVLDAVENRFRLRWPHYWSVELWSKLRQLQQSGKRLQGIALLPNAAPNIKLVGFHASRAFSFLGETDEETGEQIASQDQEKRTLGLTYAWSANGLVFRFQVLTLNGSVSLVVVNRELDLDELIKMEDSLAVELEKSMRVLLT